MQRAAELSFVFAHTRPDGTSYKTISKRAMGENAAAGQSTAKEAFTSWKGSSGHYKNMIKAGYTNIGIGHFTQGGTNFWIQIFSTDKTSAVEKRKTAQNATAKVKVVEGKYPIEFYGTTITADGVHMLLNESVQLKAIQRTAKIDSNYFTWSSSNTAVATIAQNGTIKAKGVGKTKITATVKNGSRTKVSVYVTVKKDFTKAAVSNIANVEYTGEAFQPKVTVTYGGKALTAGTDYSIAYKNNINAGTASVIITGKGHYSGTITKKFAINRKNMEKLAKVSTGGWNYSSFASPEECLKKQVKVKLNSTTLKYGTDYSFYNILLDNKAKKIKGYGISFKNNYSGTILLKGLESAYIKAIPVQLYTGKGIRPKITVYAWKDSYATYTEGVDYRLSFANNLNVGTATITVLPLGNNYGSTKIKFYIRKDFSKAVVADIASVEYTGKAFTPKVSVTYDGKALVEGKDYSLSYKNNIDAGNASVVITGKGEYSGAITKKFKINRKDVSKLAKVNIGGWNYSSYADVEDCLKKQVKVSVDGKLLNYKTDYTFYYKNTNQTTKTITAFGISFCKNYSGSINLRGLEDAYIKEIPVQFYTGSEIKPEIIVYTAKNSYTKYKEGVDYKLSFTNNVNVGTATVTVLPLGYNYGAAKATFRISKNFAKSVVTDFKDAEYTGNAIKQSVTVKYEGQTLSEGRDYEVVYSNNVNAGKATVKINGKGEYSGSITKSFNIKSVDASKKAKVQVKGWNYSGYSDPLQYAREHITVSFNNRMLKCGTDYSVTAHYNTSSKIIEEIFISFSGNYKGSKTVRCLESAYIEPIKNQCYTGAEIKPEVKVYKNKSSGVRYVENIDYKVTYQNNKEPGTATVVISPLGDNYGSAKITFRIYKDFTKVSVSGIKNAVYSGKAIKHNLSVTISGQTLKENYDYVLAYENNTNAGTAHIIIKGIGDYEGSITKSFKIIPKDISGSAKLDLDGWDYSSFSDGREYLEEMLTVTADGKILSHSIDYYISSITLNDHKKLICKFDITFKGNYSGSRHMTCLETAYIQPVDNQIYTGSALKPKVELYETKWGNAPLVEGVDYSVKYSDNVNAGTATITISPLGDSYGCTETTFKIVYPKFNLTLKGNGGTVSKKSKVIEYKDEYGTMPTAKRKGYKFTGWYTAAKGGVKVTAKTVCEEMGNKILYAHWQKVTVAKPSIKAVTNLKGKKLKVTVGKVTGAKGYQVVIATNAKFTKGKRSALITSGKIKTFKNLSKKTYYVKVRAYKLDSTGQKVYSKYSSVKKIKIKK